MKRRISFIKRLAWMSVAGLALRAPLLAIGVTFQVDLSIQEALERFRPGEDIIEVRGSFNDWLAGNEMMRQDGEETLYVLEVELEEGAGTTIPYKFVIVNLAGVTIWEGDVGVGQSDRTFVLESTPQVLPLVYFDNLDVNPGAGVEVTFQVDMAAQMEFGVFDPELDFVEVRGPFSAWEGGLAMTPVKAGSTVFQVTTTIKTILPGSEVPYKYIINGATWENGGNRMFVLEESPQTVPVRFFDDVPLGGVVTEETEIVFTVAMSGAVSVVDGSAFDPEQDRLYINGDFIPGGWWQGEAPAAFELLDDGNAASGDALGGDGVYSFRYSLPAGSSKRAEYKYFINGEDNEAAFEINHVRFVRLMGAYRFPVDTFGTMTVETGDEPVTPGPLGISAAQDGVVTLRWANPNAVLEGSVDLSMDRWDEIPGSAGRLEMEMETSIAKAAFFRLTLP